MYSNTFCQAVLTVKALLEVALLVTWAVLAHQRTRASIPAAALGLVSSLGLIVLSQIEHTRSLRPSAIIEVYLFFTVLCDAVQLRTLWLQGENTVAGILSAIVVSKIAVLFMEMQGKKKLLRGKYVGISPETTSGILNRSTFFWMNQLFRLGFRKIISLEDLSPADEGLLSQTLCAKLEAACDLKPGSPTPAHSLLFTTLRSFKRPFAAAFLPRLVLIGFNYSQPFLIYRVVDYIGQPTYPGSSNDGYGLIGATAIIYIGIAVSKPIFSLLLKTDR